VSKPFKWWVIGAVVLVILASLLGQSSAYFFKLIVDAVSSGKPELAIKFALFYPIVIFVEQLLYRGSALLIRGWVVNTKKYGYDLLSQQLMQHSHSYFSNRFAGSLMSKVNNVCGAVDSLIPELLWTHLSSLVYVLVTIGFLISVDVSASLIFILLIVVLLIFNRSMSAKKAQYSTEAAAATTTMRARLVDVISNIQAVRQYVQVPREEAEIGELTTKLAAANSRSWGYTEKMLFYNVCILFVFSMGMFWSLMKGWQAGTVSTGDLILILALYSQITGTLTFIGRAINKTAQTVGEMEEGLDDILVPFEIVDTPIAQPLEIQQAQITWNEVDFKFDEKAVFDNFNLYIPAGQRLGLVGQSGAGKTTFVSLLLRQHELLAGLIAIDGQNIAEVTQDSLRSAIAVVPQEPALFHRTIRENICYSKPAATDEEMIAVAQKAQAHDFIMELPLGYDTMVGERGIKLSGGQKQRVAIARAMLKDAPILVLDEATSALDSESEVAIQKALETLMEGRTVIAIAHRLSTLRKMDRIIVMENGKIIEDGNHEDLAKSGGVYERLWNHQAGGFLQDE
jgi:ATP-binding cassette subfamily B protein